MNIAVMMELLDEDHHEQREGDTAAMKQVGGWMDRNDDISTIAAVTLGRHMADRSSDVQVGSMFENTSERVRDWWELARDL